MAATGHLSPSTSPHFVGYRLTILHCFGWIRVTACYPDLQSLILDWLLPLRQSGHVAALEFLSRSQSQRHLRVAEPSASAIQKEKELASAQEYCEC